MYYLNKKYFKNNYMRQNVKQKLDSKNASATNIKIIIIISSILCNSIVENPMWDM